MHQGLLKVTEEFISIEKELAEIKNSKGVEGMRSETSTGTSSSRSLPSGNDIMVGFDEHLNQIRIALASNELDLQVVPVVGMGGIGKTTLATNVYKDPYLIEHFQIRAWVSVSQEYMVREIVLALLQQINSSTDPKEVEGMSADELGTLIHKQLFGRRYLLVLDDMWDIKAWDILKRFFPNNSNGSRILVTTRLFNLAEDFNSCRPYQIGILNEKNSWDLILDKVFGKEACPIELENIGRSIARKCGGLPLGLVVIGGLLAKSEKTKEFWEYVEENVTYSANNENDEHCAKILRLSYRELPVHLKPCFLYLVVFPKTFEIRTSRLIRLWVAEGFIKSASDKSVEEVAGGYFKDLVDRNLFMVGKRGHTGKVKNWSIHDLVRDLFMREAHINKFIYIVKLDNPNTSPQLQSERRLSIHTEEKVCEVLSSAILNRSFLSYSDWESWRCVADWHVLLRVLDAVDSYSMDEILHLINSRYITCSIPRDQLQISSFMSLLWNIQTLVFPEPISLPSEFWQMPQLRHLKMPGITIPDSPHADVESENVIVLEHLQTLSTVKDFVFREQILRRIPNLKKLGIDCDTSREVESFCLSNLVLLDRLELLVLAFRGTWENMDFPVTLKKLTLSHCEIPWEDMYMVGLLPNLEVLNFQTHAAKGRMWNPNVGEFCRLKFLLINMCELEIWGADDTHFRSLEGLQLIRMRMEIPIDFAEILTLQTIDLNCCSKSLFASAKRMSKERETQGYEALHIRSFHSEDATVEFVQENLRMLLLYHAPLLKDVKGQVETLHECLSLLKGAEVEDDLGDIRSIVHEAQDIIDAIVTQAAVLKTGNYFRRAFRGPLSLARKVEVLLQKFEGIRRDKSRITDFPNFRVDYEVFEEYGVPGVRETIVVGLEDEVEKLKEYLSEESDEELDVVPIIGMPGLGKTTLAGRVFCDPEIQDMFPTQVWVSVSQEFTKKHVFHVILKEFTTLSTDVIDSKSDEELAKLVVGYMENSKFLLVMDDVRNCEDWDKLCIALPKSNKKGKVLITSRQPEVGWHVNHRRGPYMLRFLTPVESCLLLQLQVFHEPKFPPELEVEGELIAKGCDGLPLAIVVVAGILVKRFSGDMSAMKKYWEILSKSFDMYLNDDEDVEKRMEKIILLSYEKLPDHLRECFLYFGMFPDDFEIPSWKLIRLWIAEGLIRKVVGISPEGIAENYLQELITRNLVKAEKFKLTGKVKTCRIHDMLRDFCLNDAGNKGEDFLQEIKRSSHGCFHPPVSEELKFRRLCIHSNFMNFVSRGPYGPSVRSFVCFSRDEMTMPAENISAIPIGFKLLRVLDVSIKFTKLPSDMYRLLHLRYLVLSVNLKILPSAFSELWNIQTLVVGTDSRTLEIRADILNMIQLRHFKTKASATLPKTSQRRKGGGEKIQTLGTISPESCTEDVFDSAHNLKKLGVRGTLAVLLDEKTGAFESLGKLGNLEKLKLLNDVFPVPPSGVHLRGLPPAYKFPPKLKMLTLSGTSLEWRHMSSIGLLENLEVLKLKDRAFQGEIWEATDGGFRRLQVLHIGSTNLKIWLASRHHFPRLKHLQLNNCKDLQQVPIELADVPSFQKLDLFRSKQAVASAKEIEAKIKQDNLQPGNVERRFRLSISTREK